MKTTIRIITLVGVIGFAAACASKQPPVKQVADGKQVYKVYGK